MIKELQALCLNVTVLNDSLEPIKIKESVEEELEELQVNIEGTEGFVPAPPTEEPVEVEEEPEEDIEEDFGDLPLDGFGEELEFDDFNDEH